VVDQETGRGVPMVELTTTHQIRYFTDSNGIVAFDEPGLMNTAVFFSIKSHGYEFPKDGFGYSGKRLAVVPGGEATLRIKRINIAQRLYRVTGAGIYRDSLLTGHAIPIRQPVLNGQVLGSDSVMNAVFRGKIYWFWGDTNRPSYPLGNFHVPGATSLLPGHGGLDPEVGIDLEYFVGADGFAKETAKMPGQGPTWIGGLVALEDETGRERMFAGYVKVEPPLTVYERGLVEFNDEKKVFEKRVEFEMDAPLGPRGHAFGHVEEGTRYIHFSDHFPPIRVPATVSHLEDSSSYESFTCLKPGSRAERFELDRDEQGVLHYGWKADTAALSATLQGQLVKQGRLQPGEGLVQLQDPDTGKSLIPHNNSVYWNDFRKRWVMILLESFGTPSVLGEIWYVEADTPQGPWVYARKIVTHDKYSFYNPTQHPMFDSQGGREIFFEGTYTTFLTEIEVSTPRYNYNQIMYKLDLSDPRLVLPVAVYRRAEEEEEEDTWRLATRQRLAGGETPTQIAFFAPDRAQPGVVPVYERNGPGGQTVLEVVPAAQAAGAGSADPLFYALPAETESFPPTTTLLYEFVDEKAQRRIYATLDETSPEGYQRASKPLCRVWKNPYGVAIRWGPRSP
jgi:hypothetical protein